MAGAAVIRDTGETLVRIVAQALTGVVPSTRVVLTTPDGFDDIDWRMSPAVSVFLYRVAVNAAVRNGPRRTLPAGGTARPLLPLELHYLVTPWANEASDEHLIAGRLIQAMYDRAELGPSDLQGNSWEPGDSAQVVLESLPTEEHYRIWDSAEKPYRLSLAYQVRIVGIEPTEAIIGPPVVEAVFGGRPT